MLYARCRTPLGQQSILRVHREREAEQEVGRSQQASEEDKVEWEVVGSQQASAEDEGIQWGAVSRCEDAASGEDCDW